MPNLRLVGTEAWGDAAWGRTFRRPVFRDRDFSSGTDVNPLRHGFLDSWGSYDARQDRYSVFWALYEGTPYERTHPWSNAYKAHYQLYESIRGVQSPAYRLVEFWANHLYVGGIDPAAGDGRHVQTAIPVETATASVRPALAKLWHDSNWQQEMSLLGRYGASMGDFAIRIADDPLDGQVRLVVTDPRTISELETDPAGRVTAYLVEETVPDPEYDGTGQRRSVLYREACVLDGGRTYFATYRDDEPYPWNGVAAEWEEPYGFVPMAVGTHVPVKSLSPWGMGELQTAAPKIRELDHLGSLLSDQIAKMVDAPWLFSGVTPQSTDGKTTMPRRGGTWDDPYPNRSDVPALYGSAEAKAQALVSGLDLPGVVAYIQALTEELKDDFPEIRRDIESAVGDASGKALRVARQRVEAKAQARRAGYDRACVQAFEMALAIGGMRGYPGYGGFGLGFYLDGVPNLRIGHRPVFMSDPQDKLDLDTAFWANAESADRAGCPLPAFLKLQGWSDAEVAEVVKAREKQMADGLPVGRAKQASPPNEAASDAIQAPGGA